MNNILKRDKSTYYVVAQKEMGLNYLSIIDNNFVTDYMLGTIFFVYYLLFIYTFYLYKLDVDRKSVV